MLKFFSCFAVIFLLLGGEASSGQVYTPEEAYKAGLVLIEAKKYEEAAKELWIAAENGNLPALGALGDLYVKELIQGESQRYGIRLLKKAAELGDKEAQYSYARCYEEGIGVEQDVETAKSFYGMAAKQGHELAKEGIKRLNPPTNEEIYASAKALYKEKKYLEAAELFRKLADIKFLDAQMDLANMYKDGIGVARDDKEAARFYGMAADQGNSAAQNILGEFYISGTGVEKSEQKAMTLFSKAAANSNPVAQYNLGMCYEIGIGTPKNILVAETFYKRSASNGYAPAVEKLRKLKEAQELEAKRIAQASADIKLKVLSADKVVSADVPPPTKDPEITHGAQYKEAIALYNDKKYNEAFKIFSKMAGDGSGEGEYGLGLCYEEGNGAVKSIAAARAFYSKSAAQGYKPAIDKLQKMGGNLK